MNVSRILKDRLLIAAYAKLTDQLEYLSNECRDSVLWNSSPADVASRRLTEGKSEAMWLERKRV